MRMKARLENLLVSAKSVTALLKTWLFSWWAKHWTFLFIEYWKHKYAKMCLFLKGFKTPSYFLLFLSGLENIQRMRIRGVLLFHVYFGVSGHGQWALAHLLAKRLAARPLSAHVLWPQAGMDAGCIHFASLGRGREFGHWMRGKGVWSSWRVLRETCQPKLQAQSIVGGRSSVFKLGEDRDWDSESLLLPSSWATKPSKHCVWHRYVNIYT